MPTGTRQQEVAAVRRLVEEGLAAYNGAEKSTTAFFALVNAWQYVDDSKVRFAIGTQILGFLQQHEVRDQELAREVLSFVGTKVCRCDLADAWGAVGDFLKPECWLSVNFAALKAASRLLEKPNISPKSIDVLRSCIGEIRRLSVSTNADVRSVATKTLARVEQILASHDQQTAK